MYSIETLPKCIKFDNRWYTLHVHVTAWNKLCLCYQLTSNPTIENSAYYNIFSQVIEPDMEGSISLSSNPYDITDTPDFEIAVAILHKRINNAIEKNIIKVIYK